jgi:predicted RNA binding protein YcfA (HicA-like mRNA interferase family)
MKARDLLAVLTREPLSYEVVRQRGSHRRLKAPGRPPITFAFHAKSALAKMRR